MLSIIIIDYKSIKQTISFIKDFINKSLDLSGIHFIVIDNSMDNMNYCQLGEAFDVIKNDNCIHNYLDNPKLKESLETINFYNTQGITLISAKTKGNFGYAKGNNIGALLSKSIFNDTYVLFSNNDLALEDDFNIYSLIDYFNIDKNIAVIGPKIVGTDGNPQSPRKKISIWRSLILRYISMLTPNWFKKFVSDLDYSDRDKYTYWVSGCFMLVDSQKFFEVEMFDENTFLYAEEMILAERLALRNYCFYFVNGVKLTHFHGTVTKNAFEEVRSLEINFCSIFYFYKNYIKSNIMELILAKVAFNIFKALYPVKYMIKKKRLK